MATANQTNEAEVPIRSNRTRQSRVRLAPRDTLLLLGFLAGFLGLAMIQFEKIELFPFWLMVFFFGMMVWLRSAWALTCLFIVLFTIKFFGPAPPIGSVPLGGQNWHRHFEQLFLSDMAFTLLALGFAGVSFRLLETHKYNLGFFTPYGLGTIKDQRVRKERNFPSLLGGRWWLIPASVGLAFAMLFFYPLDSESVQKYWIRPAPMRLIFLFGALFILWFLTRSVCRLIMRWKMGPDQASVHVRSIFAREFWNEQRAIESRRAKLKLKQQSR